MSDQGQNADIHCVSKNISVSLGSVATFVRCGATLNADSTANFLTSQPVKELRKSADIRQNYRKSKKGDIF